MFELALRDIDDVLRKEAGCTTELDYKSHGGRPAVIVRVLTLPPERGYGCSPSRSNSAGLKVLGKIDAVRGLTLLRLVPQKPGYSRALRVSFETP